MDKDYEVGTDVASESDPLVVQMVEKYIGGPEPSYTEAYGIYIYPNGTWEISSLIEGGEVSNHHLIQLFGIIRDGIFAQMVAEQTKQELAQQLLGGNSK